jgi:hypothetical protein
MRNAYKILVIKLEGKRPLQRFMHRWKDNIKMHLKEIRYDDVVWIHLNLLKCLGQILSSSPPFVSIRVQETMEVNTLTK